MTAGAELDAGLRAASDAPQRPDAPAGGPMIYTSGTTGRPKGVKRHRPATLASFALLRPAIAQLTSSPTPYFASRCSATSRPVNPVAP